jgi:polysaccharide deacetylase 2 family uncharacterized protein YibQ
MPHTFLAAFMLLQAGGLQSETPLESIQSRSLCKIGDSLGQMDVLADGKTGISIRIITEQPRLAYEGLNRLFFLGKPPGISEVTIVKPKPQLALIVDDLGLHPDQVTRFWKLKQPLTWAILPDQKWTERYSHWLKQRFSSILVHVPMEPEKAGHMTLDGYLKVSQKPKEQLALFGKHLTSIPGAIGFNNHMGSRLTSDSLTMAVLLRAVPKSWVVLDSRTSSQSQLARLARPHFPTVERTHFLDNDRQEEAIFTQLEHALAQSLTSGKAVAIGHTYPETSRAIERFLKLHGNRVNVVPIERLSTPVAAPAWMRRCPPDLQAHR